MEISNITTRRYDTTSFGPAQKGRFDFTPLFEDTFLSIVPFAILLLAIPARLAFLRKQRRKVLKSSIHGSKLVCLLLFTKSEDSEN